jgi:hypothetical protein
MAIIMGMITTMIIQPTMAQIMRTRLIMCTVATAAAATITAMAVTPITITATSTTEYEREWAASTTKSF